MTNKLDCTELYCPSCRAQSVVQVPGGWFVCESCRNSFEASAERIEELKTAPPLEEVEDGRDSTVKPWYVRAFIMMLWVLLGIAAVIAIPVLLFYAMVVGWIALSMPFHWYAAPSGTPFLSVLKAVYDSSFTHVLILNCIMWFFIIATSIYGGWWSGVIADGIRKSRE